MEPPETHWEVIVVGAGAAGLVAAERSARRGRRTLLLEKNARAGVKILMSGGTRCNLTHETDRRGIVQAFGQQGPFLHSALAILSPGDLVKMFHEEGVATKVEETGKIFPVSDDANDVLEALLRRLTRSGATLSLREPVLRIDQASAARPGGAPPFLVATPLRTLTADKLIVTTGGRSYPGSGTSGDGYPWLEELGHTIVPLRPALTPVTTHAEWVRDLKGLTLPDVLVQVLPAEGGNLVPSSKRRTQLLSERRGSLLFTHFGLSGPVVLDVSRAISGHPRPQSLQLVCDLLPAIKPEPLMSAIQSECAADGKRQVVTMLSSFVPRRLAEAILTLMDIRADGRTAELSKAHRQRLVEVLKNLPIPVSGTMGFRKAEVTAGGVSLDEVDSRTMQSKRVPNLYLAGEILDLDGPIGGYNFQAAFSTGMLAGNSV